MKNQSTFYNKQIIDSISRNVMNSEWARGIRDDIVEKASYWVSLSDEELWGMMFGNTIMRAWSVWSDGFCPSCRKPAVMYSWIADPVNKPWKLQCPNCGELFPKNDFYEYYKTGLDESGVFSFDLADKSLLFNEEHPGEDDPLHKFGVDDGNGYAEGENRWRFIGAYLIYGQWKKLILEGLNRLSAAYVVTTDILYAHKAGILLDRVADLYATFDFTNDGIMYEGKYTCPGYVSYCVDACCETRNVIIAYDRIFDSIKEDKELVQFLSSKSKKCNGVSVKKSFEAIQKNIESNILQHVLDNPEKTDCNYPNTDITYIIARMVTGWKDNRTAIMELIRRMATRTTAVDGVTGEKGLAAYSAWTIQEFAKFLGMCCFADDNFLKDIFKEFPQIYKTYKFHMDTWCLDKYYPLVGDTGNFAKPYVNYMGVTLNKNSGIAPSMFTFLWKLYELTEDTAFIKLMYMHNGYSVKNLPYDVTAENPEYIQKTVQSVIDREGAELEHKSVNKEQWGIAVLTSGKGKHSRAVWMHYDTLRDHYHMDAMNIGLFGKGLDLMPDFGYPPVQYGGWYTPQVYWYQGTASHNTVMVDRMNQKAIENFTPKLNLWGIGECFKAIRVSEPRFINGKQYERTVMLIDLSQEDSYILDIFRVAGGKEHVKFMHSSLSTMTVDGLELEKATDFDAYGIMENFKADVAPVLGWKVDWKLEPGNILPDFKEEVHLKYTDVTKNAEVYTADAWVALDGYTSTAEAWIPRILLRKEIRSEDLLQTAFAGVIEPYSDGTNISEIKRLNLTYVSGAAASDADIAIQIDHADGKSDLVVSIDVEDPAGYKSKSDALSVIQKEWDIYTDCELFMVRKNSKGIVEKVVLCKGSFIRIGEMDINFATPLDFKEIDLLT